MGHIHGADGALGNAPDGVLIGVIAAEELVDQVPDRLIGILDLRGNDVGILGIGQVNVLTGGVEALLLGGLAAELMNTQPCSYCWIASSLAFAGSE